VLAAGSLTDSELYEAIEGKVSELYRIGDCVEPRDIMSAVTEGYFTALHV
jgi:2,4-dienoyl-CoA reductase (NADPH2)